MSPALPIARLARLLAVLTVLAVGLIAASPASAKAAEAATKEISSTPAEKESCGEKGLLSKLEHPTQVLSVECMTKTAVRTIFGMQKESWLLKPVLGWIIEIPNFVHTPGKGVGDAEWLSEAIAFALLGAVITFAVLHFWAAGFTSQGGGNVMDGAMRCTGAALFILAWPFIFTNAGNITDAVTRTLLPAHAVDASIAAMVAAGAVVGAFAPGGLAGSLIVSIGLLVAFLTLLITLFVIKIGLLAGLLVAFVGMPIAIALWPIPSLSGPATYGVRFIGMVYSVVILWALCFKVYGAVNTQFVTWGHQAGFLNWLMLPLVGIAELGALLAVTRHATAMWNVASGKGTVGSIATFAASSTIANRLNRGGGGGGAGGGTGGGSAVAAMAVGRLLGRQRGGGAGDQSSAGGGRGAGRGSGAASDGQSGGARSGGNGKGQGGPKGSPPPGSGTPRRTVGADGLPEPRPGQSGKDAAAKTLAAAMARRSAGPPSVATTRGAIKHIAAADGGRYAAPLRALIAEGHDDGATLGRLSGFAAAPGLSPRTGEALERIMAAEPATRTSALSGLGDASPSRFDSPFLGPPQVAISPTHTED